MNTSSRRCERIRMRQWFAKLTRIPLAGYPSLLANGGGIFKMLIYTRRDSLAENRAFMNKQVSSYS